jgi:glycosyltransferase involved in cell wall biosynthesis
MTRASAPLTSPEPRTAGAKPLRLLYVACPTSLTLGSANAVQTFSTLRELRRLSPWVQALVPRWPFEPTRFSEVGALHLPRPAVGKLSRLYRTTLWSYAERSLFAAMTAGWALLEALRGRWIDVAYVRDTVAAFWWAVLWGKALGVKVVYEAHDLESRNPSRAKEAWVQGLLRGMDRGALQKSARVVSLTEDFRRLLAEEGLRERAEVAVIPDAFDAAAFRPGERGAARARLGLDAGDRLVVYAGLTFAYRRLELLLQAVAALRPRHPRLRAILVGGRADEIASLRDEAARSGLGDAVVFTGPLDQEAVLGYLQAADVLAIPDTVTDVTASPLKLFEYLATARGVVLPDLEALREILPAAVGYYFRRGEAHDLARALEHALTDPERPRREAAGREAVRAFTYEERARRILATSEGAMATPP